MGVGNCPICFHPLRRDIDKFLTDGAFNQTIVSWIGQQKAKRKDPDMRVPSKDTMKKHREQHLGLAPLASGNPADAAQTLIVTQPLVEEASNEDIYARARAKLAGKLDDLSAKELHTLVIEGMKLERAKAAAKTGRSEDDEPVDPEAAADAERAVKSLRIAS